MVPRNHRKHIRFPLLTGQNNRQLRFTLFGIIYFAQGAMMSYILTFNILYLGEYGYGDADVGVFHSILAIPFVLKMLFAVLSDRVSLFGLGHRRPYIIFGLLLQGIAMFVMASMDIKNGLGVFALVAFFAAISMSAYDTATDGFALDITPEEEQGTIQGIMVGARAAGLLLVLLIGGWVVERLGWIWLFRIVGILAFLPLPLVIRLPEGKRSADNIFRWNAFRAFTAPPVFMLAGIGLLYSVAIDGTNTFLSRHLKDVMDVPIGSVTIIIALGMGGRILGALSSGWVTDQIGQKKSLWLAVALTSAGSIALAFSRSVGLMAAAGVLFGLAYGYYTAAYAAVAMGFSNPRIAASMFAIFMMMVNLGTAGGQGLGGILTQEVGFYRMCLLMGALNLLNLPLVYWIFNSSGKRNIVLSGHKNK